MTSEKEHTREETDIIKCKEQKQLGFGVFGLLVMGTTLFMQPSWQEVTRQQSNRQV